MLSQCSGCHLGACCRASCRSSGSSSNRRRRSFLALKERGDRSSLRCCGRSNCRRSGVSCGGILFSDHVHVVGGLHIGWFSAHRGVLCGITGQMLHHPGDSSRGPVNTCGATSGGVLSYVTPVVFCGRCAILCGCVIFCRIRYAMGET